MSSLLADDVAKDVNELAAFSRYFVKLKLVSCVSGSWLGFDALSVFRSNAVLIDDNQSYDPGITSDESINVWDLDVVASVGFDSFRASFFSSSSLKGDSDAS